MSNGDMKAYPCANGGGLTKRELFAMTAHAALLAAGATPSCASRDAEDTFFRAVSRAAARHADALLSELAKEPQA